MTDLAKRATKPMAAPRDQNLDTIKTLGYLLDDLEKVRIMNGNRIGTLERDYGKTLPHLDVVAQQMVAVEHLAELELIRAWRRNPLAPWAKQYRGVGEKSIARLVAQIGDPADRPNVAKLWAYCGHGDPARRRRKGMTQDEALALGNPGAKKQTWLIATAIIKSGVRKIYDEDGEIVGREALTPQAQVYVDARHAAADKTHQTACLRCGPSGHPAAPGSPWSPAHQHAHALRLVGKGFLKDLWIASRQTLLDTQRR